MPCGTAPLLVSRCQSGRPPGSTASTVACSAGLSASISAEPTASPSSSAKAPAAESSDAGPGCVSGSSGTVGSDGVGTVGSAGLGAVGSDGVGLMGSVGDSGKGVGVLMTRLCADDADDASPFPIR